MGMDENWEEKKQPDTRGNPKIKGQSVSQKWVWLQILDQPRLAWTIEGYDIRTTSGNMGFN